MKLVSLDLSELPTTVDAWRACWGAVGRFERGRAWAYGDLFLQGREFIAQADGVYMTFEEQAREILKLLPHVGLGIEPKTLANWGHVANKFPREKRNQDVSWAHHREVADLTLTEAIRWLKKAAANDWAVEDLRQARAESTGSRVTGPPLFKFVPRQKVMEHVRWFKQQFEDTPLDDWPKERRTALKREYQPLLEILGAL